MDSEEKLKQQVTKVVKKFFAEHMSMKPESGRCVVVVSVCSDNAKKT